MVTNVLLALLVASCALNVYLFTRKPKKKPLAELQKAITDLELRGACLVEIRRVDPAEILVWQGR